ncbi:DUF5522 domain-containing protein [Pseudoalteromonas byunsanensis]|uniref:Uncharacterized protein n=1 Tax=Pseudoalteromonas byunsanensis TaxID=327939 RepID=A0A1S1N9I8_9GAMM|nr:DUF5522 domain-containing protein [Pseudoalteromonas byunsanensis]OHU96180.1 hypothetical protein BIW53_06440 [Pseudoalteromonas byunsanensis]
MALPNILPLSQTDGCLCRVCLTAKLKAYIETISTLPIEEQLALAQPFKHSNTIEGLDYDIENGLLVMNRWAHLKRGSCCGNGCRHCPYS